MHSIGMNLNQVTLVAHDIAVSIAFYKQLGFEQIVDSAHYARFVCESGVSRSEERRVGKEC